MMILRRTTNNYDRGRDDCADSDGDVGIVCNVGDALVELYVLRPMSGGEKVLVGRNYIKVFDRSKRSTFVHNSICDFPKLKFTGASVLPVQDYKIIKEIVKSKILKIAIFQNRDRALLGYARRCAPRGGVAPLLRSAIS